MMSSLIGSVAKIALLVAIAAVCEVAHIMNAAHLGNPYYLLVSQYRWPQLAAMAVAQAVPTLVLTGIVPLIVWATFGSRRPLLDFALLGWGLLYLPAAALTELSFMTHHAATGTWPN